MEALGVAAVGGNELTSGGIGVLNVQSEP